MEITELAKPVNVWCPHCSPKAGCKIYEARPAECQTFACLWLAGDHLGLEWKPDRSKMVLTSSHAGNGVEIRCDPFNSMIRQWAIAGRPTGGTVIVLNGKASTLIAPEGDFPLGEINNDERIAMEFRGDQLLSATVMKADELEARQKNGQ
jgi:hypothetical protein